MFVVLDFWTIAHVSCILLYLHRQIKSQFSRKNIFGVEELTSQARNHHFRKRNGCSMDWYFTFAYLTCKKNNHLTFAGDQCKERSKMTIPKNKTMTLDRFALTLFSQLSKIKPKEKYCAAKGLTLQLKSSLSSCAVLFVFQRNSLGKEGRKNNATKDFFQASQINLCCKNSVLWRIIFEQKHDRNFPKN